ncbi:hypothetical protein [Stenotrophomonas sp.]|uniref:hypothetical protein n=1 Tax=Stenotrophomonas sp. TaxID=69392 RepID=UPI0028A8C7CF|nr:hypothetical protein [Stenotrophomonas sp.]
MYIKHVLMLALALPGGMAAASEESPQLSYVCQAKDSAGRYVQFGAGPVYFVTATGEADALKKAQSELNRLGRSYQHQTLECQVMKAA